LSIFEVEEGASIGWVFLEKLGQLHEPFFWQSPLKSAIFQWLIRRNKKYCKI
jgi:hypothetical protein